MQLSNALKIERFNQWAEAFLKCRQHPMSDKVSTMFFTMSVAEHQKKELPAGIAGEFSYQVAEKRAEVLGLKISPYLIVFLSMLVPSVGSLIMYLYVVKHRTSANELADMRHIANLFPNGFLSESDLEAMWDAQKICDDRTEHNLLDIVHLP